MLSRKATKMCGKQNLKKRLIYDEKSLNWAANTKRTRGLGREILIDLDYYFIYNTNF
jgi:hypothetical protein